MSKEPEWMQEPEMHDFSAAYDYLTLLFCPERVNWTLDRMYTSSLTSRKAKDIMRASGLILLPKSDESVSKDLDKIEEGKKLSPVLLVRDRGRLHIADGYHRVCACYHLGDNTIVPCLLTDMG